MSAHVLVLARVAVAVCVCACACVYVSLVVSSHKCDDGSVIERSRSPFQRRHELKHVGVVETTHVYRQTSNTRASVSCPAESKHCV